MKSKEPSTTSPTLCEDPIFIMGIMERSGTNFLYHLLHLHPDCNICAPIYEDYLTHYADLLVRYAKAVYRHWRRNPFWGGGVPEGLDDILCQYLGNGLLSFLTSLSAGKRPVTKTPGVHNLRLFFKLFPRAYLLILVRDGRAVVESSVKTFGWKYEATMRRWADAARTIISFERALKNADFKYLVVRYDDLCNDLEGELRRIFVFLGLDVQTYNFDAAMSLPVRGSSLLRQEGDKLHWEPVEKPPDFDPLIRWSHWNRALHERFNWIAGHYLVQFGYQKKQYATNRLLWTMWNKALDIRWRVKELKRTFGAALRRISRKASLKGKGIGKL